MEITVMQKNGVLVGSWEDDQEAISKLKEGVLYKFDFVEKKRTEQQNSCMWAYLTQLAKALNDGGFDVQQSIKVPINFDKDKAKEYMFDPVMKAITDKKSSTKLTTTEMQEVYETLNRFTCQRFGIGLDWPNIHNGGQG